MKKLERKMVSLGFQRKRTNNLIRGNDVVQIVHSSEFQRSAIRVSWREEWKDYFAIIFDYSPANGPICIVPTKVFFNSHFVSQKRNMTSYINSRYCWSQPFKLEDELPQLILRYENKWEILGGKTEEISLDQALFPPQSAPAKTPTKTIEKNKETEFEGMLKAFNDKHLLRLYCDLMEELRQRNIVRSGNNPVSDYGEKIVAERMNLKLSAGSNKGYDAIDEKTGVKYQIKSRRLTKHNGSKQLGVIRNLDQKLFDYLVAVIFNEFLMPQEIWQMPIDIIPKYSKFSQHQNGHILILAGDILQDKNIKKLLLGFESHPLHQTLDAIY